MRLIFSILTAIVVLVAGVIFIGPMFISTDEVRSQLLAQFESVTGYRLRVSGPVDISLFPSLQLVANDVGIAQPETGSDAEIASAKTLKFGLMLGGLISGKMQVTEVTLIDPVVNVPKAAPSQPTQPAMVPAQPQQPGLAPGVQPVPAPASKSGSSNIADTLKNLTLDELVIRNGTVILPASEGAPGKQIDKLDLDASLPAYDQPLTFKVGAVVDGKAYRGEGGIGRFGHFLEGAPAPVRVAAEAPGTLDAPVNLSGTATYRDDTFTFSQFSAKSGNKTLAGSLIYKDDTVTVNQFTGTMGRDTFAGSLTYKDDVVTIRSLRANVRGTVLAGSATANLAGQVPYVAAAFAAKTLDVNALTGKPKSKKKTSGGGGGGGGANKSGKSSGWSNEKIDFSPLRLVNGKFSFTAEQLIYDQVTLSPVSVQATLNGGKLNATLSNFNIYGGSGDAAIAVNASGKTPAQRVNITVKKFDAYPLLRDAADFERIEGRGTVVLDLSGYGASQRAIVSTLNGSAKFKFVDGAIRGVNVAKMIRNLGTGVLNGWQGGAAEKTDFAELGASFQVAKGQATTNDLRLAGPLVNITGAGTVNLPAQSLKFKVEPQLVASLEGQGRKKKELAGLGVPVMIEGPWAKPKIYPDIKGILQDPAGAIERFKNFGDGMKNLPGLESVNNDALQNVIKDGKVNQDALVDGIGGLLGGSQAAPQAADPNTKSAKKKRKKNKNQGQTQTQSQPLDAEDAAKQLLNNFLTGQ